MPKSNPPFRKAGYGPDIPSVTPMVDIIDFIIEVSSAVGPKLMPARQDAHCPVSAPTDFVVTVLCLPAFCSLLLHAGGLIYLSAKSDVEKCKRGGDSIAFIFTSVSIIIFVAHHRTSAFPLWVEWKRLASALFKKPSDFSCRCSRHLWLPNWLWSSSMALIWVEWLTNMAWWAPDRAAQQVKQERKCHKCKATMGRHLSEFVLPRSKY